MNKFHISYLKPVIILCSSVILSGIIVSVILCKLIDDTQKSKKIFSPNVRKSHFYLVKQFDKEWSIKEHPKIEHYSGGIVARFNITEDQSSRLIKRKKESEVTLYGAFTIEEIEITSEGP